MNPTNPDQVASADLADPRWRDLYRIGAIVCILFPLTIVLAIIAYFIWPYTPGFTTLVEIYELLQNDLLGGLMSLDLMMVLLLPVMILHLMALYVALKQVNESFAFIALVFGLIGNVLIFTARPLAEMVQLSDLYTAASSEMDRSQYLAAGEAIHAIFNGTAWMWWNIFTGISYLISALLMLRSERFSRATGYVGITIFVIGFGWWLPAVGPIFGLLGTAGSVVWFALQFPTFRRLGWDRSRAASDSMM